MQTPRFIRFITGYALVGVGIAVGILWFFPDMLGTQTSPEPAPRVVEFQQAAPLLAGQRPAAGNGPVSYADAVDAAAPAVVNIFTSKRSTRSDHPFFDDPNFRRFFGDVRPPRQDRERTETNLGSGVIISGNGFVLTNYHVIDGADEIQVALNDGRSATAHVVGSDPDTDLAVLKISLDQLPVITLGSSDEMRVGDVVLAIGNPFGVGQTVTQGIVSATGRSQLGLSTFENFIQTDAAINPGNSGGALINAHGEMVGVNTAIFTRSGGSHGIGFAIPVGLVRGVMEDIIANGRVIRGWAGVEVQDLTAQLAESFNLKATQGVIVAGVMRDGPAARAGLVPGDLILKINGNTVTNSQSLLRLVTDQLPGQSVRITGISEGRQKTWDMEVRERPRKEAMGR